MVILRSKAQISTRYFVKRSWEAATRDEQLGTCLGRDANIAKRNPSPKASSSNPVASCISGVQSRWKCKGNTGGPTSHLQTFGYAVAHIKARQTQTIHQSLDVRWGEHGSALGEGTLTWEA